MYVFFVGIYFRRRVQKIFFFAGEGGGALFSQTRFKTFLRNIYSRIIFHLRKLSKIFFHKGFPKPYWYPYLFCILSFSLSLGKDENMSFAQFRKMKSQDWFSKINNAKKPHKRDLHVFIKVLCYLQF